MASLALYERMSHLSHDMVTAAETGDWDRLGELEREVGALRDQLIREEPLDLPLPAMDAATRQRKIALIQSILANDREIRIHTEPWMASVRAMLSGRMREQHLRKAYGA